MDSDNGIAQYLKSATLPENNLPNTGSEYGDLYISTVAGATPAADEVIHPPR